MAGLDVLVDGRVFLEGPRWRDGALWVSDMHAHEVLLQQTGSTASGPMAALHWATEVMRPGAARAHQAVGGLGDPIQAYCDLLEVRWLLSEEAGAVPTATLGVSALKPGMVLARDLTAGIGVLLLSKDHALDDAMIRRLDAFQQRIGKDLEVIVYRSKK